MAILRAAEVQGGSFTALEMEEYCARHKCSGESEEKKELNQMQLPDIPFTYMLLTKASYGPLSNHLAHLLARWGYTLLATRALQYVANLQRKVFAFTAS